MGYSPWGCKSRTRLTTATTTGSCGDCTVELRTRERLEGDGLGFDILGR